MSENKPDATAATAQTQEPAPNAAAPSTAVPAADNQFVIAPGATIANGAAAFERRGREPVYRPLKIFTLDPSISRLDGAIATLQVPYEPLQPGPRGSVFEVDNDDGYQKNQRVDLDDPLIVMSSGLDPTPSDPRFHQQMVYAVASSVHAVFRTALGRQITWKFPPRPGEREARLMLRPHGLKGTANAFYDPATGSIDFGYFQAAPMAKGRNLPGSWVFTCLSHDIIAHEVSHALLDTLRTHFTLPTNPDVAAFHEALADLVAVFQHFSYRDVLERAIAKSKGSLQLAPLLTEIAWQFSETQETSHYGQALRSALGPMRKPAQGSADGTPAAAELRSAGPFYGEHTEPHALGSVLVAAIFEAFTTVYNRKANRYVRLATGGSGVLPPGELAPQLLSFLADKAAGLASNFLSICIRAVDYCPPVDLLFGEYLRALITADYALVPDDPWMYREALVDSFRRRGIFPTDVPNLSEDALLWRGPDEMLPPCAALSFAELRFRGDPSAPAGTMELQRQAHALGVFLTRSARPEMFGLVSGAEADRDGLTVGMPTVQSIRTTRRVGPAGQVVFDVVAEVTQSRTAKTAKGATFQFYGGSTIVLDPEGKVRYIIVKNIKSQTREDRQRRFMNSPSGRALWVQKSGAMQTRPQLFRLLHDSKAPDD